MARHSAALRTQGTPECHQAGKQAGKSACYGAQAAQQVQALEQEKAQLSGALEAAEADRDDLQQRLSFAQAATPRCPLHDPVNTPGDLVI